MKKTKWVFISFLFGGAIGSSIALLYAPESGKHLRNDISDENKEFFEKNFPAQFVAEYIGQVRAWFYYMIVLSAILFEDMPFENDFFDLIASNTGLNNVQDLKKSLSE